MSAKWRKFSLGELTDWSSGGTPPKKNTDFWTGTIPWISASSMHSTRYSDSELKITPEGLKAGSRLAPIGSILLLVRGSILHQKIPVGIATRDVAFNQDVKAIKVKKHLVDGKITDNWYLFYWFKANEKLLLSIVESTGIGAGKLGTKQLQELEVDLPSWDEQQKIVAYCKAIEEKEIINAQINQTLEQIAQAIFKSWFVDFEPTRAKIIAQDMGADSATQELAAQAIICGALTLEQLADIEQNLATTLQEAIHTKLSHNSLTPINAEQLATTATLFPNALVESELGEIPEGWTVKALDKIAHYQNGLALQNFRPEEGEDSLPVLKIAQLRKGFADGEERASVNIRPECIVDNGDVIFSWSGSLIVDIWCGGKVALNQHLFKVTSQSYPKWFYYYWTKRHLEVFQQIAADKAVTMGHIKREHLSQAKCLVPTDKLLELSLINSLLEKQVLLSLENFSLENIRDALLPKLLSGELDVSALADNSAPAIKTKETFDV